MDPDTDNHRVQVYTNDEGMHMPAYLRGRPNGCLLKVFPETEPAVPSLSFPTHAAFQFFTRSPTLPGRSLFAASCGFNRSRVFHPDRVPAGDCDGGGDPLVAHCCGICSSCTCDGCVRDAGQVLLLPGLSGATSRPPSGRLSEAFRISGQTEARDLLADPEQFLFPMSVLQGMGGFGTFVLTGARPSNGNFRIIAQNDFTMQIHIY